MRLLEENGHTHDFDVSAMKPGDTWHDTTSTINGRDGQDNHSHNVSIFFDSDKKKFIVSTESAGRTFSFMHSHPSQEIDPSEFDKGVHF